MGCCGQLSALTGWWGGIILKLPGVGSMAILVVGGTGQLGGRVVALLQGRGEVVRCLVRAATDDSGLRAAGVEIVRGDLTDPISLPGACAGVTVVVATATVIARRLAGARHPTMREVDEDGMTALVDAAERAGVERFVYVSYAGAGKGQGSPLEHAKVAVERRLATSTMRTVIIRPDAFQEVHLGPLGRFDLAARKVSIIGKGTNAVRWVSTDDVAALLAAVAVEADPPALIEFGGPEALSRNEAADVAERALGRTIKRQHLARWLARVGLVVFRRSNDAVSAVFGAGLAQDLIRVTWDDSPLRERGITPRSASDFIKAQAAALR